MPDDAQERLRSVLGAEPPASVLALPAADVAALADTITEARKRQAVALQKSFDASLKHVPFPVRGIVKKVLLG